MAGQILKVKMGYNPNSSSIGSLFSTFLWISASGAFLMAAFADLRPTRNPSSTEDDAAAPGPRADSRVEQADPQFPDTADGAEQG
jgi:hypothetical protein